MNLLAITVVLTVSWTSVQCGHKSDKLMFHQNSSGGDDESVLMVTWKENKHEISASCKLLTEKEQIKEALSSDDIPTQTVTRDEMHELLIDCIESRRRRQSDDDGNDDDDYDETNEIETETTRRANAPKGKTTETPSTTQGYDGIPVIFPGTKWCGAGDRAKSYDDLGLHQDTDRCCRAHDLCNDTLAPGETRKNLTNTSPFTKLSCQCDKDFYDCLDRVNSVTSNTIGNVYFNVLKRECYREDYPETKKCIKYRTFLKLKCLDYERDTTKPKVYQWVRAKKYRKIPFPGSLDVTLPF